MLSSALIAGFLAGLLCALLQFLLVQPDILMAERYESGELVHFQGVAARTEAPMDMKAGPALDHGASDAGSVLMRHGLTVLFAVLTYCGYGLVLLGGIQLAEQSGIKLGTAQALLWGLAGFMAFQMMPALGLEPELPGTPPSDLTQRQLWWAASALATIIGLWFLFYGTALWQRVLGVGVLTLPYIWGAPKVDHYGGIVPPELSASFAAHSLGVGLITWMALGALVVHFWHADTAR